MFDKIKKIFKSTPRRVQMEAVCTSLGMDFNWIGPSTVLKELEQMSIRYKRSDWEVLYVISATDEEVTTKVMSFDLQYTVQSQYGPITTGQTIFFTSIQGTDLPEMSIRPEHIGDRLLEAFISNEDIDFERYPQFSKNYFVKGASETHVRAAINDEFVALLKETHDWRIESAKASMILYKKNKYVEPKDIEKYLNFVGLLHHALSRYTV